MDQSISTRIEELAELGRRLQAELREDLPVFESAYQHNNWFTTADSMRSIDALSRNFLDAAKLTEWAASYDELRPMPDKRLGLIMAGNLPLVGFHDWLCAYLLDMQVQIKRSSKDQVLWDWIGRHMEKIRPGSLDRFRLVEVLKDFDAVIATGSNNSNRYFDHYFGKYPNLLRKNRNSVAVIKGDETDAELMGLADDIFMYFGLGCRNVSHICLPEGMDIRELFPALETYRWVLDHHKYKNNFDYQLSLRILNNDSYVPHDFAVWQESEKIGSPLSCLHYSYYKDEEKLVKMLTQKESEIQVICSASTVGTLDVIPLGRTQEPRLSDYPDRRDIMRFLLGLQES